MADGTPIEWTDATWNPITGCSVVSPGCTNCYAMKLAGTRLRNHPSRAGLTVDTKAGPVWNGQVRLNEGWLDQPMRWRRPRRIFVCAHGDLFHESVPYDWIDRVFAVMAMAHWHTFQVLTKRAARMREYCTSDTSAGSIAALVAKWIEGTDGSLSLRHTADGLSGFNLPNVWLGVSVEDQRRADERMPLLLQTPAAVRWISAEPLLGPVDLRAWIGYAVGGSTYRATGESFRRCDLTGAPVEGVDWVVAGGESGPGARPMHPDWARSLRDQCAEAGVPFLFKQWGAWAPDWDGAMTCESCGARKYDSARTRKGYDECGHCGERFWLAAERPLDHLRMVGKKAAGRHLDGVLHDAYPEPVHG